MDVAIINSDSGIVQTVVSIETLDGFNPGAGLTAVSAVDQPAMAGGTWSESGGFQPPPVAAVPVPAAITPLQARNCLREWGIGRAEIASFLASIPDEAEREAAEDAWEYATTIQRGNPLIAACAAYLGKSETDIDQFFRDAVLL